ncbi:hypothetical protein Dimus_020072, partial [Dionaea muscipula]
FKEKDGPKVVFVGNEKPGETKGSESIIRNGLIIKDVAYVQGLKFNLLSTSQFCDKGYVVKFSKELTTTKMGFGDITKTAAVEAKTAAVDLWQRFENCCICRRSRRL